MFEKMRKAPYPRWGPNSYRSSGGEVDKISSKFILCYHACNSHDSLFYKALILQGEILC